MLRWDVWISHARDALKFGEQVSRAGESDTVINRTMQALRALVAEGAIPAPVLKNVWGVGSKAFKVQLGGIGMFVSAIVALALLTSGNRLSGIPYKHVVPTEDSAPPPARELPTSPPAKPTLFNESALPFPKTGRIRSLWKHDSGVTLAPLRIVTAPGSPNYYVKIVDWETGAPKLLSFIRSGEIASLRIPVGSYQMRYAAGEKWYGEEYLFGPETAYRRADDRFDFRIEGNHVHGFTIELIKQIGGNLKEKEIAPSDF